MGNETNVVRVLRLAWSGDIKVVASNASIASIGDLVTLEDEASVEEAIKGHQKFKKAK